MADIDLDFLRTWVGREQTVLDPMTPFPARAWAAALDHAVLPEVGDALPLPWHWLYFLETPTASGTGADGHPKKGGFLPPVPLPRRMWASGELKVSQTLRLGTPASKVSRVQSVSLKEGKTGALVFVTVEHVLSQAGQVCITEKQHLVYRDMPTQAAPLPPGEVSREVPAWTNTIHPDPVLLFRFSALTYNCHRIHYDRDYAVQQEFYPGLVVHGPLLATLLLDAVATHSPTTPIKTFEFRAVRPTFDLADFQVHGCPGPTGLNLWTSDAQGYVGMSAQVGVA